MKEYNKKITIIAEAGVNHNGSLAIAKKLIDAAKNSGADIVKFQNFKTDDLASKNLKKPKYTEKNLGLKNTSQYDLLKSLELSEDKIKKLNKYAKNKRIEFLSTPFDIDSIELLKKIKLKRFKIPSGELTNLPYLRKIGSYKLPIILSTGMAKMSEIRDAIKIITKAGTKKSNIIVLHCTTDYPANFSDINLNAMISIQKKFGVKVGYSDHTLGYEVAIAAAAMGAIVIEKHITLSKKMHGPDHNSSLEPDQFTNMVKSIRNIEKALGSYTKSPSKIEIENKKLVRKSIIAKKHIRKNEKFSESNITTKRPGTGISPMRWFQIIGRKSKFNFKPNDIIKI